jgi:hypothetical protein
MFLHSLFCFSSPFPTIIFEKAKAGTVASRHTKIGSKWQSGGLHKKGRGAAALLLLFWFLPSLLLPPIYVV